MAKQKPLDECKTPRDLNGYAVRASKGEAKIINRGNHTGIDYHGHFVPTGNRPNQELPPKTAASIRRSFIRLGLVIAFAGFLFVSFLSFVN